MKRLVVSGLACPVEAWEKWLGKHPNQRIISLAEVFDHTDSSDLREMSKYIESQIATFKPESIVCHGFGVSMTLLSLMRLRRSGYTPRPCLTIFNGALRGVSLLKANHPFRAQVLTFKKAIQEIGRNGGQVDPRLRPHMHRIRAMYRYIILFNMVEAVGSRLQLERMVGVSNSSALRLPMQLIVSPNDPYIPYDAIQQLRMDFRIRAYHEMRYGHFPYSISSGKVLPLLEKFEKQHSAPDRPSSALNESSYLSEQFL